MGEMVRSVDGASDTGITISPPQLDDIPEWLKDLNVTVRWFRPLVTRSDGTRRSIWPQQWSTDFLLSIEHTQDFSENYDNSPWLNQGVTFDRSWFQYGSLDSHTPGFCFLSVDPARTWGGNSDFTGLAVVKYSKAVDMFEVCYAEQRRINADELRQKAEALIETYNIETILIEVNTDLALAANTGPLTGLPAKVVAIKHFKEKRIRHELAALEYFNRKVLHTQRNALLEGNMMQGEDAPHDDMVDAVCQVMVEVRKRLREDAMMRGKTPILLGRGSYR
jgi:hypothetical protein